MEHELDPLHEQLDYRVSRLTQGLSGNTLTDLLQDAKNHAAQLNESSASWTGTGQADRHTDRHTYIRWVVVLLAVPLL